jgi:protease I
MAGEDLKGLRAAILATDGFQQVELMQPHQALDEAGVNTRVVAPKRGKIRGWNFTEWRDEVASDMALAEAHYRKPADIPAFNRGMIELFSQTSRHRQAA